MTHRKNAFAAGMKDAIPIGLGYLAVGFSLGIVAKQAGLSPFQGFLTSLLGNASAGESVAFAMIAAQAGYFEMAVGTLIANARYLLMSASLAQRLQADTSWIHRLAIAYDVTDELFGIGIAKIGSLGPFYMYGAYAIALPGWSIGTALGVTAGILLPLRFVSALSVALYGMFIAIIIPPAKTNIVILGLIMVCFICSFLWPYIPVLNTLSSGTKTIVLTIGIAAMAALIFPRKEAPHDQ